MKTEQEISELMEQMLDNKYVAYGAVVTAWEELECAKNAVKKQEAIIKLELKAADPKMTIDLMNSKLMMDDRYNSAIAGEIEAEAAYKLAMGEFDNYADNFKKLGNDAYMLGKVSI